MPSAKARPSAHLPAASAALAALRAAIAPLYRAPEAERLAALVPDARLDAAGRARVEVQAKALLADLRKAGSEGWVEQFLQEYSLTTEEGVALLSLAEAYLRVPDTITAAELVRDKLGRADWKAHKGASDSVLVNSATLGLILARSLMDEEAGTLKKLVARLGEPAILKAVATAMQMMGEAFVLGRDIEEALKRADRGGSAAFRHSFDMLGEAAKTAADADRYLQAYVDAIEVIGKSEGGKGEMHARDSISVKLSAIHPRYETGQDYRCVPELIERTLRLARLAKLHGIGLTIDAEEAERLEMSLDIIAAVAADPDLAGWDGLGMAVQAYQRRAPAVVAWVNQLGLDTGRRITVRLVKGAYWDTEIKRAQERGQPSYPLFTRKPATDVSYLACAKAMLASPGIYPAFATHNALTVATILDWAGDRRDFEFQRLHGMGAGLYERIIAEKGVSARVYAPVGGYRDLLAYLVRRLLENGANTSFVHQIADDSISDDELLADPVAIVEAAGLQPHSRIPTPMDLYAPERRNSAGLDLTDRAFVDGLVADMAKVWAKSHAAAPLIGGKTVNGAAEPVVDPADTSRTVGTVVEASVADVQRAIGLAAAAQHGWSLRPVEERAAVLETMADLMERDRVELMALAIREAGKSIPDALAEVREAVDFCRYYAVRARETFAPVPLPGPTGERNELTLAGRGVFAAISPWNFPLAIFLGQVAAALVAGNSVVAKPAPQTPLIAFAAAKLLLEAGVPGDVFHLVPGGPAAGQALTEDIRTHGVVFTGSTATARRIAKTLLEDERRPLVPLIAETGGLNAMIVDSTALPEQVVNDVIISAFQSAGQRCSALRLLCLQEDIADKVLEMLQGAMAELTLGDPGKIETDIGPVIDEAARDNLNGHIEANRSKVLHQLALPAGTEKGTFVAPTVIGLDRVEDLTREWFGPVLHVVTWKAGELDKLVARINASGYGLTMGLHSRIGEAAETVRANAKVGNLYVNRSMIGAVVGVQPFGGEGLSGTGPKAGGPHYLARFAVERTLSVDTTSAGGNATLLSLED
ncbi:bifunctional proline dehydrogenase/L-glutamate gamma-semialdehyde dehydrogenase PutA [Caulobacter mirabilis]|uniref:Bifunctional protein PutA n=1 Tax=Caulobacter mirabilis TaxID=69666 RepID=A0A2D2B0N5_9CAUL|nr:bifunctional proline dehydrogenase/L-glutamate gamma-semialdehyde dehydrogenase PutA [Caulobacter mirabilis]ATQ43821.1 bifunctional proline dehydrogenase/L-glutamate gamma-semialdehyde dehydrogenase [Caulobacter mirabilis]